MITVKFERISRDHEVPDLEVAATSADDLAQKIWAYARPRCLSRDISVFVDLEAHNGAVMAGFHNAGDFTFTGELTEVEHGPIDKPAILAKPPIDSLLDSGVEGKTRRQTILDTVADLVTELLWEDRAEDEVLPRGAIEEAVQAGEITLDEIVAVFRDGLVESVPSLP